MRVIVRRCEGFTSQLIRPSCPPRSNYYAVRRLRSVADPTRQFARWFTSADQHKTGLYVSAGPQILEGGYSQPKVDRLAALKGEFDSILGTAQPDLVMAALLNSDYEELVASMPHSTFIEAFHLLSPDYFVEPYKIIHNPLHPEAVRIKRYKSLRLIFDDFARNISAIIQIRRSAGHVLGLAEYTHLLDCARSLGDALMADYIWYSMKQDDVIPDVRCYNHYMEVKVWDMSYTGREKYRLRMTPHAYRNRRFDNPNDGWKGYGTAARSVRKEVLQIFNEMTEAGNEADETSIVNILLASSRVGYMPGMKNILKAVWNIDADALKAGERVIATEYDRSSPVYPTRRLLLAVAHAFGTNNDIPGALRIIDHISKSYDIEVPGAVWLEIFERSFVLSRPRNGADAEQMALGQVSFEFLRNLYRIMTSEPFNVKPTVNVHRCLAKTAWHLTDFSEVQYHMRAAYEILAETRRKRRAARKMVESYLKHPRCGRNQIPPEILQSRGFADAVHAYDILRLSVMQQTILTELVARWLLTLHRFRPLDEKAWWYRMLPRALEEWSDFLPETFIYNAPTGVVQIKGKTRFGEARVTSHKAIQVRRPSLDDDFALDEASTELDDDFIWAEYKYYIFYRDLNSPLLKKLFEPVHINEDVYEESPPAVSIDSERVNAEFDQKFFDSVRPPTLEERHEQSRKQMVGKLIQAFGALPAGFTAV